MPENLLGRIYDVDTFIPDQIMQTTIRKWGNSPAVRLPAAAIKEAAFSLEQKVNLTVTRDRIVIEPSSKVEYDLDQLVGRITAKNLHAEVSFDKLVGKEALGDSRLHARRS